MYSSFCELDFKYNEIEYISMLKLLDLLPLQYFFQLKKLKLFHRIRNGIVNAGKTAHFLLNFTLNKIKST